MHLRKAVKERLRVASGFVWRKGQEPGEGITRSECEQVLLNHPRILATDDGWMARGATDRGRILVVRFEDRKDGKLRVLSASEETKTMRRDSRRPAWLEAERTRLPYLKPSTKSISLRLPEAMLEELKLLANQHDVPYQSLIKIFLAERIRKEQSRAHLRASLNP